MDINQLNVIVNLAVKYSHKQMVVFGINDELSKLEYERGTCSLGSPATPEMSLSCTLDLQLLR